MHTPQVIRIDQKCLARRALELCAFVVLGIALASSANAQIQLMPVDITGELVSLDPMSIRIKTPTGDVVSAQIDPRRLTPDGIALQGIPEPEVIVQSIAKTDYIRRGMFVSFLAPLDVKKRPREMLNDISVIWPNRDTVMGFIEQPGLEVPPDEDGEPRVGLKMYRTTGEVREVKRGTLTLAVQADRSIETIRIRVSGDAEVKLAVPDLRLAKAGDKVVAKGFAIRLPQFYATQVTITRPDADADKLAKGGAAAPKPANRPRRPGPLLPMDDKPDDDEKPAVAGAKRPGIILKIN